MLNFRLNFKIFLTLFLLLVCLFTICFLYSLFFSYIIYAYEGQSLMERDGWTKDPNLELLKPFPWDVVCIYFSINFIAHLAITLS
jgi:hypothetical protein